jgi:hypothetical protein
MKLPENISSDTKMEPQKRMSRKERALRRGGSTVTKEAVVPLTNQTNRMNGRVLNSVKKPSPEKKRKGFDVMDDPDFPENAADSNIIIEEIEMNGKIQRVFKKTYYLLDGTTKLVTRME